MAKARDYLFQLKWTEQPQGRAIVEGRATMNGGGPRGAFACNLSPGSYRGCNCSYSNASCDCHTQLASFSYRSNSDPLHR